MDSGVGAPFFSIRFQSQRRHADDTPRTSGQETVLFKGPTQGRTALRRRLPAEGAGRSYGEDVRASSPVGWADGLGLRASG